MMTQRIEISTRSLVTILAFLVGLWVFSLVYEILIAVFVSFIAVSTLGPLVDRLIALRFPKTLAVATVFVVILLIIGLILGILIPPLADQTAKLASKMPEYIHDLAQFTQVNPSFLQPSFIQDQIAPLSGNLFRLTLGIFTNVIAVISFLVFTFYLLLERQNMDHVFSLFLNRGQKEQVVRLLARIEERLGAWSRGEFTLMTLIGVATFIGLSLLGVPFALPLAVFAGLLEIIPVIGPIIAALPAVLIAATSSPVAALAVMALYFIVQQAENHILVPKVMQRAVGLSPIVTILAITIGGKLLGILGGLLAVPIVVVATVVMQEVAHGRVNFTGVTKEEE